MYHHQSTYYVLSIAWTDSAVRGQGTGTGQEQQLLPRTAAMIGSAACRAVPPPDNPLIDSQTAADIL